MIIEILKCENRTTNGAIGYNLKKEKELVEAHDDIDAVLTYNLKAKSKLLAIQNSIDDIGVFRRSLNEINAQGRAKEPLFHVSINFPPGETISDELLLQIAQDYMSDMGYGDQPYAIWQHFDRPHQHIHIVSTRVDRHMFKKINDSLEKIRSMKLAERYEQRYGLKVTKHTKGRDLKDETIGVRNDLDQVLSQVLKKHPHSMAVFKEMLAEYGVTVKGENPKQVLLSIKDADGKDGKLFESSKLNAFRKKNVREQLRTNRIIRNKYRAFIKESVTQLLNHYGSDGMSTRQFQLELRKQKIYVSYEENSGGIYGIKFHYRGFELKGSDIDKDMSWNVLQRVLYPMSSIKKKMAERRKVLPRKQQSISKITGRSLRSVLNNLFQGSSSSQEEEEDERQEQQSSKYRIHP